VLNKLEKGEVAVRVPQLAERVDRLELAMRRMAGAVIFAALLVSGVQLYLAGQIVWGGLLLAGAASALAWLMFPRRGR
jgi:hypothetical protein